MNDSQWNKWKKIAEKMEDLTNLDLNAGLRVELNWDGEPRLVNYVSVDESDFLDSNHSIVFGYHDGETIEEAYVTVYREWELQPHEFLDRIKVYKTIEIPFSVA